MKSFVSSMSHLASQLNLTNYDININCNEHLSEFDLSEKSKIEALIKQTVINVFFKMGSEDPMSAVEVVYSVTGVPLKNVYCAVTIESESGSLGALCIKYDRNTDTPIILDQTFDL